MILGLCSSFAVVPALSLVNGSGGSTRRLVGPARQPGDRVDLSDAASSEGLAALLTTNAAFSAVSLSAEVSSGVLAATSESPTTRVAKASPSAPAVAGAKVAAPAVTGSHPATTSPTVAPRPATSSRSMAGVASWLDIAAGTCATNDAPMGSVITVTNGVGVSVTCKVVSRGPFVVGRVVDLARSTFASLGPVSKGLVTVVVSW